MKCRSMLKMSCMKLNSYTFYFFVVLGDGLITACTNWQWNYRCWPPDGSVAFCLMSILCWRFTSPPPIDHQHVVPTWPFRHRWDPFMVTDTSSFSLAHPWLAIIVPIIQITCRRSPQSIVCTLLPREVDPTMVDLPKVDQSFPSVSIPNPVQGLVPPTSKQSECFL